MVDKITELQGGTWLPRLFTEADFCRECVAAKVSGIYKSYFETFYLLK